MSAAKIGEAVTPAEAACALLRVWSRNTSSSRLALPLLRTADLLLTEAGSADLFDDPAFAGMPPVLVIQCSFHSCHGKAPVHRCLVPCRSQGWAYARTPDYRTTDGSPPLCSYAKSCLRQMLSL